MYKKEIKNTCTWVASTKSLIVKTGIFRDSSNISEHRSNWSYELQLVMKNSPHKEKKNKIHRKDWIKKGNLQPPSLFTPRSANA